MPVEAAKRKHAAGNRQKRDAVRDAAVSAFAPEPRQIARDSKEEEGAGGEPAVENASKGAILRVQPTRACRHRAHHDGEKQEDAAFSFRLGRKPGEAIDDCERRCVRQRCRTPAQSEIASERRANQHPRRFGIRAGKPLMLGEIADGDEDEADQRRASRASCSSKCEAGYACAVCGAARVAGNVEDLAGESD